MSVIVDTRHLIQQFPRGNPEESTITLSLDRGQSVGLARGVLREARVEAEHVAGVDEGGSRDGQLLGGHEPADLLRAGRGGQGARVRLEAAGEQSRDNLGHDEGASLGLGAGDGDVVDLGEDGLEHVGGGTLGVGAAANAVGKDNGLHGDLGDVAARAGGDDDGAGARGRGGNSNGGSSRLDVDVDANDGGLGDGVSGLEDHVHLHGHGDAVVHVLGRVVEVELLELELGAGGQLELAAGALHDDLDGGAEVLKDGALGLVGDLEGDVGSLDGGEDGGDHVDGRLVLARVARSVLDCESVPYQRALCGVCVLVTMFLLVLTVVDLPLRQKQEKLTIAPW